MATKEDWEYELESILGEWGKNAPALATLTRFFRGILNEAILKEKRESYRAGYKSGHMSGSRLATIKK